MPEKTLTFYWYIFYKIVLDDEKFQVTPLEKQPFSSQIANGSFFIQSLSLIKCNAMNIKLITFHTLKINLGLVD